MWKVPLNVKRKSIRLWHEYYMDFLIDLVIIVECDELGSGQERHTTLVGKMKWVFYFCNSIINCDMQRKISWDGTKEVI